MPTQVPERRLDPLLLVIVGPTASGKTTLSLAMAERFDGEIVNCDSVAMYREFEIGTAKPAAEERSRVPHHLVDVVDLSESFDAAQFVQRARAAMVKILARHGVLRSAERS